MRKPDYYVVMRYGVAVLGVLLAVTVRLSLDFVLKDTLPFITLFIAVMLAAWYGGFGPALLATMLGAVAVIAFVLPPRGRFVVDGLENQAGLVLYFLVGLSIAVFGGAMRTARIRAEDIHRRADAVQARLAAIVESTDVAIIGKSLDGIITSWNAGAEQLYGYAAHEVVGQSVSILYPTHHAGDLFPVLERLRRGDATVHFETVRQRKNGTLVPVAVNISPIWGAGGEVVGASAISHDLTQQKQAEQTLRESEERLRLAFEAGRMGTWEWNLKNGQVLWSPGLEAIHNYAPGSFPGTFEAYQAAIYPDDRERVMRSLSETLKDGKDHHIEYRQRGPSGEVRWFEGRGKVYLDDSGKPQRMIGVCMDITERKRAERALRFLANASAALAGLVDPESTLENMAWLAVPAFADWCIVDIAAPDGSLRRLAVAHAEPKKSELAQELRRRFPAKSLLEGGPAHVLRTGKSEWVAETADSILASQAHDPEDRRLLGDLGIRSYLCVPLKSGSTTLGALSFFSSESGRHFTQADLTLAEDLGYRAGIAVENAALFAEARLAARRKDEFLAVLAHELRNPLAPIGNAVQIMRQLNVGDPQLEWARDVLQRQVRQLRHLVDDLLDVSRISRGRVVLRKEIVELRPIVNLAAETAQPYIAERQHHLDVSLPEAPIYSKADPLRLEQVLTNLLNNACKYTEPGGRIWLTAQREGKTTVIRVQDTGIGIAPELLPHVFEMFVQSVHGRDKNKGGLGIGLSLVRSYVERHGGTVTAWSQGIGKGSEFVVRLPVAEEPIVRRDTPPVEPRREVHRRILVVDDNIDAAASLAKLLRLQGHEVKVAHDGPSALEVVRRNQPELVFLDIGLPGMDGYEVARRIRPQPGAERIGLVALTGWGQEEARRLSKEAGFDYHLTKPIEMDTLEKLLADPPSQW